MPQRKRRPLGALFGRPVKTLVWAFCIGAGVAILALLSTGIARETQLRDRGPLIVSSSLRPDVQNANLILLLRVSTSDAGDHEIMRNLRLRLSEKDAREIGMQVVSPPAALERFGDGRYYVWKQFAPGQTIKVLLRPHHTFKLELVANGFNQFLWEHRPSRR